jgi:hypothetical protein
LLWIQNMEIYLWCFSKNFILLIYLSHFWRVILWTRKVSFWDETYLHLLNSRIYIERSFENLHYTNHSQVMYESTQILMNENNKSFYPLGMFEFIHHPKYGCRNLKGLMYWYKYIYLIFHNLAPTSSLGKPFMYKDWKST